MSCEQDGSCVHVEINNNARNWLSQMCSLGKRNCESGQLINPQVTDWSTAILQIRPCGFMSYLFQRVQCEIPVLVCVHSLWVSLCTSLGMFSLMLDQNKLLDRNRNLNKLYILKKSFLQAYNFQRYGGSSPLGVYLGEVSQNCGKTSKFKSV